MSSARGNSPASVTESSSWKSAPRDSRTPATTLAKNGLEMSGATRTTIELTPLASELPTLSTTYPSSAMACRTREMLSADTRPRVLPLATRETVAVETPARAATIAAVTRPPGRGGRWGGWAVIHEPMISIDQAPQGIKRLTHIYVKRLTWTRSGCHTSCD